MSDAAADVIDGLANLAPGSALAELRRQRPDVVQHLQGSDEAIFSPKDDGGLSRGERAAAGLRIAALLHDATLQDHYTMRLAPLDPDGELLRSIDIEAKPGSPRWAAILAHVDRVTSEPDSATRDHIKGLFAAGLTSHAVVSLSQVIAYVNFQARVLAGLRMLRSAS